MEIIQSSTAVSITVVFTVLGVGWKLSAQISTLVARVDSMRDAIAKLDSLPERFGRLETKVEALERDVADLWSKIKA